ncbi:hypothetical protein VNO78_10292 [Psophocarpus tetragonolobus]|uniref:Uncharacterized protein n=1 Tax=Psophocarpus tetragonolobus TaxID=3891 RepID=A0AAN9SJV8_PSOTE
MASAQCEKPNTTVEVSQPKTQHKPNSAIEVCQPKTQHSSFGQKLSDITSKAFKGRHGSNQNQLQCYSQTQVESLAGPNGAKTDTHYYGQTQTHHDKKHGVSKTQITVTVIQAQITHTKEDPYPYGTSTACFGTHAKKNGELNNNKKDMNLFRRIKNGLSRHSNNDGGSSSSSDSESDDEKCPKTKVLARWGSLRKCISKQASAQIYKTTFS